MNIVFFDVLDICVVIYQDDLFAFSQIVEEHQKALDIVFPYLAKHQLYLRLDTYELLLKCLEFLRYVLDALGVHIQKSKIAAITEWPEPSSITQLQQFLGLSNYFCWFIQGYIQISAPFT